MNFLLYIGLFLALGSIIAGFVLEDGTVSSLWQISAFCIVFGGTFGIALIASPLSSLKKIPAALKLILFRKKHDHRQLTEMMCDIANKARKNGLLSLEMEAENISDPFIKKGLQYVADGVDPEFLRAMLENEIDAEIRKYEAAAGVFEGMGGTAPTMGVLGTVMGMITVLSRMGSDMDALGKNIAVAFIATFYGVGSANLFWLPLGQHIKVVAEDEAHYKEIILEGLMAIQSGEPASRLRDRLEAMLSDKDDGKKKGREAPNEEAALG